jgi:excisionase family DNA binding protein
MANQAIVESRYLSYQAASRYLGVSVMTLRKWVDAGQLHAYKVGQRARRFDREHLDAFVRGSSTEGEQ